MMNTLGIPGHLGADDTGGIGIVPGASDPTDGTGIEQLDLECAGAGAVVGAGGMGPLRIVYGLHAAHFARLP